MRAVVSVKGAYENVRQVGLNEGEHRTCGRREKSVLQTHKRTVTVRKWRTVVALARARRYGAMCSSAPVAEINGSLQYDPRARGVSEVPSLGFPSRETFAFCR